MSEVAICNMALSHIGDTANVSAINPPDGSVQADHCHQWYPLVRDMLLEMHNWGFATRRTSPAVLSLDTLPARWAFAYQVPKCIRVIAVFPEENASSDDGLIYDDSEFVDLPKAHAFTVESRSDGSLVLYTNVENATVLYVARVTDTGRFSPLFRMALARLLAGYLAGPIIKGKLGMQVADKQFEMFYKLVGPKAMASDASQSHNTTYDEFVPTHMARR